MSELEDVLATITSAWDATYDDKVQSALTSGLVSPYTETREAVGAFLGRTWKEVPEATLLQNCAALIGDVAFQYYLPAFMLAAIRHPWQLLDDLTEMLKPPKKPKALRSFQSRFSRLSGEQRAAVAAFLKYAMESVLPDDERFVRKARNAIEQYWGR